MSNTQGQSAKREIAGNIERIRQKLSSIDTIRLKEMQFNFGQQNKIIIEVNQIEDIPKWEYFNEKIKNNTDTIHIYRDYPRISYEFHLRQKELSTGLQVMK